MQRALHSRPNPADYPRLHNLAAYVARELEEHQPGTPYSGAYQLIQTLLTLSLNIADSTAGADWHPILNVLQQVAGQTRQPLPLKQQGLGDTPHWLTQQHQGIRLHTQQPAGPIVLKTKGIPYVEQDRQVMTSQTNPTANQLIVRDQTHRYTLEAITKLDWAERIWCDKQGVQAHAAGAAFHLQLATSRQSTSFWRIIDQPWSWAEQVGIDEYGLWATTQMGTIRSRLRWVPINSTVYDDTENNLGLEYPGYWFEDYQYWTPRK